MGFRKSACFEGEKEDEFHSGGCVRHKGTAMPPASHVPSVDWRYPKPGGAMMATRGPLADPALATLEPLHWYCCLS